MEKVRMFSCVLCLFLILVGIPANLCQAQIDTSILKQCKFNLWSNNPVSNDTGQHTDSVSLRLKSPSKAMNMSFFGTLLPLPTLVFTLPGIITGPSLGYFYGGLPGRGWLGIGLRTLGLGGVVTSLAISWDSSPGDTGYTLGWIFFITGSSLTVGSAIYDLATIKSAVRKHNMKLKEAGRFSIAPKYFLEARAPGVGFTFRF